MVNNGGCTHGLPETCSARRRCPRRSGSKYPASRRPGRLAFPSWRRREDRRYQVALGAPAGRAASASRPYYDQPSSDALGIIAINNHQRRRIGLLIRPTGVSERLPFSPGIAMHCVPGTCRAKQRAFDNAATASCLVAQRNARRGTCAAELLCLPLSHPLAEARRRCT
jgi:hypothetical protein